MTKLIIMDARR